MNKKAIIIGSTGLIGKMLLELLEQDENFTQILALVRKPTKSINKKTTFIETNFNKLDTIASFIDGDCLFICIGSTIKKAGSKEAFLKIDYDIPVDVAYIAIKNGVKSCIVVSSIGANPDSTNFYLQTKGKMEQAIQKLGFQNTVFMRPSLLFGKREEFRLGELIGKFVMKIIGPFFIGPLKKYRGIEAKIVAKAMLKTTLIDKTGIKKYEGNEIELLAK